MMRLRRLLITVLALGFSAVSMADHSPSDLIRMMRSANAAERALARQLLPRAGMERLGEIVPALADPNEAVWRTASNILTDIANEIAAPGRDAERKRFTNELLAALAAKPKADVAARLMNIVHLALADGTDVSAIAAYLDDPALRMNARDALELAATTESKAALRAALPRAEDTFALALIDALGLLRDPLAREMLEARLGDHDPRMRAAAARALAWTGDAALAPVFQEIARKAPSEAYVESGDAFLLLADAILDRGGQFDYAMGLYAWALEKLHGPVLRGATVASMGRRGDERVVPLIIKAARREKSGALDHAALEALAALPGFACSQAIFEQRDALLKQFGPSLYAAFGRRGDDVFVPLLLEANKSGDDYTRRVATLALLDSDRPAGIRAVSKYAAALEGDARDWMVDALQLKASGYRRRGMKDAAGAAYAGLYPLASTDKDRQFALDGMMRFPTEEAFALVKDLVGQDELAKLSVPFLAGIARALYDAKRPQDAERIIDTLAPRIATPADMQALLGSVRGAGPEFARKLGFVTKWQIIGPFPWSSAAAFSENHIGAPDVDVSAPKSTAKGEPRTWKAVEAHGPDGIIELTGPLGMQTNAAAYAYAEIDMAEAAGGTVRAGSDDGIKIWLNGEVVHEHNVDRGLAVDQDQAPVSLKAGKNKILVEITQGGGGWNFCLRLTLADGRPLAFTQ